MNYSANVIHCTESHYEFRLFFFFVYRLVRGTIKILVAFCHIFCPIKYFLLKLWGNIVHTILYNEFIPKLIVVNNHGYCYYYVVQIRNSHYY
jgi:hypothetical protein